jgi:sugar lactone lactonase YvrE
VTEDGVGPSANGLTGEGYPLPGPGAARILEIGAPEGARILALVSGSTGGGPSEPGAAGEAVACTVEQNILGEGARWDARRDELLRVDIVAGQVFRDRVENDGSLVAVAAYRVPGTVGAIAPIEGDEGWLLAADRSFVHLAVDGTRRTLADVAPEGTRLNDAACDPRGRFWAGTKAHDNRVGAGALYRFERDGHVELMLDGLTISNGIGWSPDGGTMYLADTVPRVIRAFSFDLERGTISNGRILTTISDVGAGPDGLTVDAGGDIWVAIFGGGRVQRYSPEGVLRQELHLPAEQTTSCAFAGRGLHRLYVTTATEDWSPEERRADPAAGVVYRFETDAVGRPAEAYRPDSDWWKAAAG